MSESEIKRNSSGKFAKGNPKIGGRTAGTVNKTSLEIKAAIELTFDKLGGVEAFATWAKENPTIFYTALWGKLLPTAVKVEASTVDFVAVLERARMRSQAKLVDGSGSVLSPGLPVIEVSAENSGRGAEGSCSI